MTDIVLQRDPGQAGAVTFGALSLGGFQTLELPWKAAVYTPAGTPGFSCVPEGIYSLVRHNTPGHPFTWALVNPALGVWHSPGDIPSGVIGRSEILIHTGNTSLDSKGCILVGLERTNLWIPPGVLESVKAFGQLKANLPWVDGHTLTIRGSGASGI